MARKLLTSARAKDRHFKARSSVEPKVGRRFWGSNDYESKSDGGRPRKSTSLRQSQDGVLRRSMSG